MPTLKPEEPEVQLQLTEFAEASTAERFFLEARIRVLYYLYAFFAAMVTLLATQVLNQWPHFNPSQRFALLVVESFMSGLLALLALLSWTTITNWNSALSRLNRQKQRCRESVLSTVVAARSQEQFVSIKPLPPSWAFTSTGATSLLAFIVFAAAILAGMFTALFGATALTLSTSQTVLLLLSPASGIAILVLVGMAPAARVQAASQGASTFGKWWRALAMPVRRALRLLIESFAFVVLWAVSCTLLFILMPPLQPVLVSLLN